ncbi:DNA repair protein [Aeromonas veronii]|uniref:DNA repair protein n=2 Tax=Aeromonas veronii TaxID=654 RepID=A0AAX2UYS1_AERVE|nr:DNA repair protein [Aeromonas veronii]TNI52113.1 DNA repair protein [Aeromonas veronii]
MIEMVALGGSLIALAFASYIWFKSKRSKQESEASVATLQGQLESLRKQMMELHTGAIGMGQRLQSVEGAMQQVNERQQELTMQDPERRLYSRAAKMVELGADLDEVMSECELPKAEAELLISLRKGRS